MTAHGSWQLAPTLRTFDFPERLPETRRLLIDLAERVRRPQSFRKEWAQARPFAAGPAWQQIELDLELIENVRSIGAQS